MFSFRIFIFNFIFNFLFNESFFHRRASSASRQISSEPFSSFLNFIYFYPFFFTNDIIFMKFVMLLIDQCVMLFIMTFSLSFTFIFFRKPIIIFIRFFFVFIDYSFGISFFFLISTIDIRIIFFNANIVFTRILCSRANIFCIMPCCF